MTKEVLVAIRGLQFDDADEETNIETVNVAEYYEKGNSRYVIYEEVEEGTAESTKNIIKFKDNVMELTKKGLVNVHMVFEENQKNMTNYATPFGDILIGIDTADIKIEEASDEINVSVGYTLEANYEHLADCRIEMSIRPREEGLILQ